MQVGGFYDDHLRPRRPGKSRPVRCPEQGGAQIRKASFVRVTPFVHERSAEGMTPQYFSPRSVPLRLSRGGTDRGHPTQGANAHWAALLAACKRFILGGRYPGIGGANGLWAGSPGATNQIGVFQCLKRSLLSRFTSR
jgi:hypothetical protein